ncbi:MAG: dihydrodipicolinate synthase family protein [Bryobacteraceae bacterium]
MVKINGILPPIATPFDHNGDVYKIKVQHNVEKWNRTGLAGYVVCGSTGESVYLTTEEKLKLWDWVAEYAASDKVLMAGTGVESVRETVDLTNAAAARGYKAAMVRTPFYYRNIIARPDSQLLYFRAVADQVKIPIMIYNWPQATGVDIPVETVVALSEHPNIFAIKESSGNLEKMIQMMQLVKPGFQVFNGSAPILAPALGIGCSGGVLAFANAAPYACVTIWEANRSRETEAAMDWQKRILRAAQLVTVKYGIPGLKYAMDLNGYYGGPVRLPLVPITPEAKQEIEKAFDGLKG